MGQADFSQEQARWAISQVSRQRREAGSNFAIPVFFVAGQRPGSSLISWPAYQLISLRLPNLPIYKLTNLPIYQEVP
jgi:hypothetical protein